MEQYKTRNKNNYPNEPHFIPFQNDGIFSFEIFFYCTFRPSKSNHDICFIQIEVLLSTSSIEKH